MSIKYPGILLTVLFCLVCIASNQVFADGTNPANTVRVQPQKQPTLDPRLPPVVPGEELVRNGKTTKVWSTSGSPSVGGEVPAPNSPPQNWTVNNGTGPGGNGDGVSVIVDGRGLLPGRGNRP